MLSDFSPRISLVLVLLAMLLLRLNFELFSATEFRLPRSEVVKFS